MPEEGKRRRETQMNVQIEYTSRLNHKCAGRNIPSLNSLLNTQCASAKTNPSKTPNFNIKHKLLTRQTHERGESLVRT